VIAKSKQSVPAPATPPAEPTKHTIHLEKPGDLKLWSLEQRNLYTIHVRLLRNNQTLDEDSRRFGFREAQFTDHGFELNGKVIKLCGLDRHQTFPWVGQAMPGRVQRRDAAILRNQLKCNIVRTSHYPQSPAMRWACLS
jgi:beta-galactosidase